MLMNQIAPNHSVSLFCLPLQGTRLNVLYSHGSRPEIVWGAPSAGGHHPGTLHWNRVPHHNSRWGIRRLLGKDGFEAGLCAVPTAVQLCDGQVFEGSN